MVRKCRETWITLFCKRQVHDGSPSTLEEALRASGEKLYLAKKETASKVKDAYAVLEVLRLEMRNWKISWIAMQGLEWVANIVVTSFK